MIRINLLGQARPKAARAATPAAASLALVLLLGFVFGAVVLGAVYYTKQQELEKLQVEITQLKSERERLQTVKAEVEVFERQKAILDQRYAIIEELQRNRTGGQELLTMIANTVTRTESLWLTSMNRRGNALNIEGTAGSMTAVANLITQMKRSGYFDAVEIRETKQDERNPQARIFNFNLTANFVLPQAAPAVAGAGRS